ncbi:amino acid adenylation domain-containing protein [Micromonospora tulbaghiae]|uniref:amino acid adenylation domain-containing protein n=1 Tax=Micromonospora tulbaghiae TaxID=479978 RepID=UPI003EB6E9A9
MNEQTAIPDRVEIVLDVLSGVLPAGVTADADTDLGDLGLGSLAAARVLLEVGAAFGTELPTDALRRCATARELAELAARAAPAGAGLRPEVRPEPGRRHEPFPLTPLQEGYLLAKATGGPGCHLYREYDVADLDVDRLRAAWGRLVGHHEALRLVLTADGRQRVAERPPDWTMPVGTDAEEVRRRLSHHSYGPADEPLWTVEVTRAPDGGGVLHLSVDAAIVDGAGLELLVEQLRALYDDPGRELPAPGAALRDLGVALAAHRDGDGYRAGLEYWAGALRDLPPGPALPTSGAEPGPVRVPYTAALTRREWAAVTAYAGDLGVSPTAVVLTAFTEALRRAGADAAFSLVLTTNSRIWLPAGAAGVPGPFTSTTVFVAEPAAGRPFAEAARAVHDRLRRDLEHADVPGVAALRELRSRRLPVPAQLPVVFTSLLDVGGTGADGRYAVSQTTGVTLDAQIGERDGELRVRWDVAEDAFAPGVVAATFAWFVNTLRWLRPVPDDAGRPLNDLQQAYFVARTTGGTGPWSGCQVVHAFAVDRLDLPRLEAAWLGLLAAHEPLRTVVTPDGRLVTREDVPDRWHIPVTGPGGPSSDAVQRDMVGRAFPLGRLPQGELRVQVDESGAATVHVALDLLVADGRSIHLLLRELMRRYVGPGTPVAGPPRAPQAPPDPHARRYWQDRLADLPPGPPIEAHTGPRRRRTARVPGWTRIRRLARERGLALDALLMAALTTALGTRHHDRFAVPLVRWTPRSEPFRPAELTALSWLAAGEPGEGLLDLAERYDRQITADAAADGASGLAELRRLVLRRMRDGGAGYPVVCTGLLELGDVPLPDGVTAGPWLTCTPDVALDCIAIDEGDDTLRLFWDATEDAIGDDDLDRIFDAYRSALAELADLGDVLYGWNDTAVEFPHAGPVHLLFEAQARARPEAVAVSGRGGTTSFGELNAVANRIAVRLRAAGVGAGSVVGISVARGPLMVAAVYGVLKAGGAYLPVEPSLPPARAALMLADAGAIALVTTGDLDLPAAGRPDGIAVVHADRVGSAAVPDPEPCTGEDDLAYVIFTSGSTGRPKGVAVTHRAVHNLLHWARRTFRFGPEDTGLCVTSLGFDLSVFDILGLLGYGASIYVADSEQQKDPALLLDVLLREPVTFWNSAPTTLAHVVPLTAAHRGGPGTTDLRLVFLSGDHTPLSLPDELRACFTAAEIVNLGGATEATVWSNFYRVGTVDPGWRSIPYGRPIDNARYYVLDDDRRPCRPGVEGDLYIAGEVLGVGYHNRPDLTEDRFVPCPYGPPGDRMYRTGDRAAFLPDGNLTFLGRADHQVKIRGFRVELGEIEHRLRGHPGVKDAVVVAREEGGERKLVAYLLSSGGAAPAVRDLRAFAAETLPDYMVPSHLAVLEQFPATDNGKLDRAGLPWPLPPATPPAPDSAHTPPGPPEPADAPHAPGVRQVLTELFADLLGETVDPAADLWDQGATSFTMVQVSARLHERLGTRVPVAALLENPTIDGIAAHLSPGPPAPVPADPPPSAAPPPRTVDVLSPAERSAFAAARLDLRDDGEAVPLSGERPARRRYRRRASRRDLLDRPVPLSTVADLLGLLRPLPDGDRTRRLYPSAGDTYAVQVYVHVPGDRVTGLPAGVYYHHPDEHTLRRIGDGAALDRTAHFVYNRPVYDRAAFQILLVGQTRAIRPLYGDDTERYLALEAGYLGQVLMGAQADHGLGLCPVGAVAEAPVRAALRLDDDHVFQQAFLCGPVTRDDEAEAPAAPTAGPPPAAGPHEIAVVGVAGRYPGADDVGTLWRNLDAGHCAITPPPPGRGAGPAGGYLSGLETFDSMVFGIAPAEAAVLDPQVRVLLEVVWACLEDAGHTPASLGRVGVFVGVMWHDHRLAGTDRWRDGGPARISGTGSEIANRISHTFDFRGPSVAVDTSCSSALTALRQAAESLDRGDCDTAVVGAVNLLAHPYHVAVLRGLGLVAETPHRALDAAAGGWSPGEGAGALLLRRLGDARRDRDRVDAVVESTWVGHSGATSRFGTPDAATLAGSLTEAVGRAGLTPADIGYVECAASGAALSDAAEIEAVGRFLAAAAPGPEGVRVPIGTVKPNLGHAEAASGLAQLTKVLLQLRHRRLVPTLVAETPHPLVDLGALPVRFVRRSEPWTGVPLRALVTAVGATGTVGHVVLRSDEEER